MKTDGSDDTAAFVGRVTASLSHQINNVLGAINELSGLIDDRLLLAEQGRPLDFERLHGTRGEIVAQVKRGKETVRSLNRFAHSLDEPVAEVDLASTLDLVASFTARFAQLREVSLKTDLPSEAHPLECSPATLEQLVFEGLLAAIGASKPGQTVTLGLDVAEGGPRVVINSEAAPDQVERAKELKKARSLAAVMGAVVDVAPAQGGGVDLEISLPPGGRSRRSP